MALGTKDVSSEAAEAKDMALGMGLDVVEGVGLCAAAEGAAWGVGGAADAAGVGLCTVASPVKEGFKAVWIPAGATTAVESALNTSNVATGEGFIGGWILTVARVLAVRLTLAAAAVAFFGLPQAAGTRGTAYKGEKELDGTATETVLDVEEARGNGMRLPYTGDGEAMWRAPDLDLRVVDPADTDADDAN